MRLPLIVTVMGYVGLIPFVAGPLWLTVAPDRVPEWLDHVWLEYVTLLAAFLAGTFWGFALPAIEGPAGIGGMMIASVLLLLIWTAMALPSLQLLLLSVVFLLLLLADFWRERTLDTIPGYFKLRAMLTIGAIGAIAWRMVL